MGGVALRERIAPGGRCERVPIQRARARRPERAAAAARSADGSIFRVGPKLGFGTREAR